MSVSNGPKKITELPSANTLQFTDYTLVVQNTTSNAISTKATIQQVAQGLFTLSNFSNVNINTAVTFSSSWASNILQVNIPASTNTRHFLINSFISLSSPTPPNLNLGISLDISSNVVGITSLPANSISTSLNGIVITVPGDGNTHIIGISSNTNLSSNTSSVTLPSSYSSLVAQQIA